MTGRPTLTETPFGTLADGRLVTRYRLDNGRGLVLAAINLGGIVTELRCPDRDGIAANVVLGFESLADYETRNPHFGTIVGRHGNRIAGGAFTLDGERFQLDRNDGAHSLHGGKRGFGQSWWDIAPVMAEDDDGEDGSIAIDLRHVSEHGDQGYPGRLEVDVRYRLTARNEWRIDYRARCDCPTVVNLTHHDYFNLAGGGSALGHRLQLAASRYCPVDAGLIPERIDTVIGTPFDFREPRTIGERIRVPHPQLLRARGYDHHFLLDEPADGGLKFAARLEDPSSGRVLEVLTTEPGLQFYSGNFLDGTLAGANGQAYRQGDGLCLETQHAPDSPNRPDWPTTVLRPGRTYTSTTLHRLGTHAPKPADTTSP